MNGIGLATVNSHKFNEVSCTFDVAELELKPCNSVALLNWLEMKSGYEWLISLCLENDRFFKVMKDAF